MYPVCENLWWWIIGHGLLYDAISVKLVSVLLKGSYFFVACIASEATSIALVLKDHVFICREETLLDLIPFSAASKIYQLNSHKHYSRNFFLQFL